jgi:hypothetical protein
MAAANNRACKKQMTTMTGHAQQYNAAAAANRQEAGHALHPPAKLQLV